MADIMASAKKKSKIGIVMKSSARMHGNGSVKWQKAKCGNKHGGGVSENQLAAKAAALKCCAETLA